MLALIGMLSTVKSLVWLLSVFSAPLEHELISAHLGMAVAAEPFMCMQFKLILFVFRYNGARFADYFCGKNVSIDTTRTENLARRWRMPHAQAHAMQLQYTSACIFIHFLSIA